MTEIAAQRWSRITISGTCLQPELPAESIVDGLVDFDLDAIEIGSFIVYREGGHPKIKKVIGLSGDSWVIRDGHILIGEYVRSLSVRKQQLLDGHNEVVPTDCLLVGSNESPDRFMVLVHLDNITHHIPLSEVPKA